MSNSFFYGSSPKYGGDFFKINDVYYTDRRVVTPAGIARELLPRRLALVRGKHPLGVWYICSLFLLFTNLFGGMSWKKFFYQLKILDSSFEY
jgi:hypothetical protein